MTAAELLSPAAGGAVQLELVRVAPVRPVHRVACPPCGWVGYRRDPWSRDCPACGVDSSKLWPLWVAGCAPRLGRCAYLIHIWPAYRHASHYLGSTTHLWFRWRAHLAGGYDPVTHKATGDGARLLAAALHHGHQIELVRVWYGQQARTLEQKLKQRRKPGSLRAGAARSLKPLCPVCDPGALRRYRSVPDPTPPPRPRMPRFVPTWDADAEWDAAFPHLAYGPRPSESAGITGGAR
jgi:hypothetical protein